MYQILKSYRFKGKVRSSKYKWQLTHLFSNLVFGGNSNIVCVQVIWRYSGEAPKALSENTKLLKWIPQNDLLGMYMHAREHTHTFHIKSTRCSSPQVTRRHVRL